MSSINTFFTWLEAMGHEDGPLEEIFSLALDADDVPAAVEWIESLPFNEQEQVKARLDRLLEASRAYQCRIGQEMLTIQSEIFASRKTAAAHSSYLQMAALTKHPSYH